MNRRNFVATCASALGLVVLTAVSDSEAGRRAHRRRVRRRIRRRHRRRVAVRMMFGRPFWVVPVGLAVGWELVRANRVVVVHEIKVVERDNTKIEVAVVADPDGKSEQIEITREDNDDNRKELEGSELPEGDKNTPGVDVEVEVEVDD
jgi:hypothetical protein